MPSNEIAVAAPYGFGDMEKLAEAIAKSGMFGIRTKDQALALMAIAQSEGRHPAAAARDYHIISGSPAKKAEAMQRDFLLAGGKVQWHELSDTAVEATFSHPQGGEARIRWDAARCIQAGLVGGMHKKYPRQMLRSRVVSEGVRTVWPLATSGMYAPEEAAEIRQEAREPIDVTPPAAPVDGAADLDAFAMAEIAVNQLDELSRQADTMAAAGREAFRAFWGTLGHAQRDMLRPDLERYQAVAAAADDERARDEDPFGLPPLGEAHAPEPVTEAPAVPFAAAVRALVPVAGDDGEPNWRGWSEAFVALVEHASPQDCEKLRLSSLPHYGKCRSEYGDGARAIVEALAAKAKEPA
jgi:hypothetical protein